MYPGIIFLPRSLKTWTWKLSPLLPPKITENHQNVSKVGPRRIPKSTLKSVDPVKVFRSPQGEGLPSLLTPLPGPRFGPLRFLLPTGYENRGRSYSLTESNVDVWRYTRGLCHVARHWFVDHKVVVYWVAASIGSGPLPSYVTGLAPASSGHSSTGGGASGCIPSGLCGC